MTETASLVVDYNPLLNPPKEPSPAAVRAIDALSWGLPAAAAVLSIVGGIAAPDNAASWAALLGIAGGVAGALGVVFTNYASRIRDGRLAVTHSLAALGVDNTELLQRQLPTGF